jgi:hypothetical protein
MRLEYVTCSARSLSRDIAATTVNGAHSKPEGSGFVCYAVRAADCIALQHYKTSINLIASPTKPINTLMVHVLLDVLYFSSSSLHRLLLLLVGAVEFASLLSLSLSLSVCLSLSLMATYSVRDPSSSCSSSSSSCSSASDHNALYQDLLLLQEDKHYLQSVIAVWLLSLASPNYLRVV